VTLKCGSEVTQDHWKWYHLKAWTSHGFLFTFHSTYGRIFSHSEIFSVKEWSDLEIWVWGRSRSLNMARFDRPCMTFYCSAIVTIALSCTVFKLFDVQYLFYYCYYHINGEIKIYNISVTLKSGLEVTQGHWKLGCSFLFAFYSDYGRICSRLWDIQCQRMAWPWKPG